MYKILLIFSGHDLVKPPVERGNRRSERHNALTLYPIQYTRQAMCLPINSQHDK